MKKVIAPFLVVAACFMLAACSLLSPTPESIAKKYTALGDYSAEILIDKDDIESVSDLIYGVAPRHISYCVLIWDEEREDLGFYLFCKDDNSADKVEEGLDASSQKIQYLFDEGIIEREGTVLFFGEEDVWEDIHH